MSSANSFHRRDSAGGGSSVGTNFLTNNNLTVRGRCSPMASCGRHRHRDGKKDGGPASSFAASGQGADKAPSDAADHKADAAPASAATTAGADRRAVEEMDVEECFDDGGGGYTTSEDDHMMSSLENIHRSHARSADPRPQTCGRARARARAKVQQASSDDELACGHGQASAADAGRSRPSASHPSSSPASSPGPKALQSMQRILNLNRSAMNHHLAGGDASWALDALHKAEWIRCHLADELALANDRAAGPCRVATCRSSVGTQGRVGLSSSFTTGTDDNKRQRLARRTSLDASDAAASPRRQRRRSDPRATAASRTSYIYQRMDFDEGMHSFADLEPIDPASFWLPVAASRASGAAARHDLSPAVEATLVFNVGQVHRRKGDLDAASGCYDRSLEVLKSGRDESPGAPGCNRGGDDGGILRHPIVVPVLHNVGQLQYRRGDMAQSMETYELALSCARSMYGEGHPHVASALNCLGVLHYHDANSGGDSDSSGGEGGDGNGSDSDGGGEGDGDGDIQGNPKRHRSTKKAMELFKRALSIRLESLGPDHVDVATALNNIGRIHVQLDEFDLALAYYEDALRIRLAALGPDSLDYAATAFNAGQSFHQKGELARASELYHEFLRVALVRFGRSHRDVAVVLSGIAQIHQERREYDRALELYEASLCAGRAALGEDHSEIAMLLNRMGNFHFERERLDDALRCYRRGLRIERRVLPPDHPNVVVTLSNLGEIHRQRGEWDEAAKVYGDCLDILRRRHDGGDHADVASTLSTVGLIHDQRGDTCLALHHLQDALLMRRRLLGNDHLDVSATLVYIGTILYRKGVLSVAVELFGESLRIRRARLGRDHRDVAFVLYNIALVHQQRGCHDEAIEAYSETLRIERLVLGGTHRDVAMTLFKLGEVRRAAGDLDGALDCFRESLAVERGLGRSSDEDDGGDDDSSDASREGGQQQQRQMQRGQGPDHATMARALNEIGNIHLARGEVVPMMEAFNEASRLYRTAGLSPGNVVVSGHLYALEFSCPEAAPAA